MLRRHLPEPSSPIFRIRSREVSRMEGFTDAVFGFALTLVVVSLEVPHSFEELFRTMRGFPAFAVCFAGLLYIWWCHNHFFRRYGLQDSFVFVLNSVLLFLVLFYVYPMKFLFGGILGAFELQGGATSSDIRIMFACYSGGWAAVFLIFTLMYVHALRQSGPLELSVSERASTVHMIAHHLTTSMFGVVSIAIAVLVPPQRISLAGWVYFALGPTLGVLGYVMGSRTLRAAAAAPPPQS